MKKQYSYPFLLMVLIVTVILFCGCASQPNIPYPGAYPAKFNELAQKNPLLSQELAKLPEIQDGISAPEAAALDTIVELYNNNPDVFDKAFDQMYQIGLPNVRKYCSPLQALFWLAIDGEEPERITNILVNFSLKELLAKAWEEFEMLFKTEKQIFEIINGITDENERKIYIDDLKDRNFERMQKFILMDFKRNPAIFSRPTRKKIKQAIRLSKKTQRWKDFSLVIDRLNAPELLDFYINKNIRYEHIIPTFHRSPRSVINEKYGDCDDLAYFGKTVLTKAGYDVFGRIVGVGSIYCHIGLGIGLEDGSYLLARPQKAWSFLPDPDCKVVLRVRSLKLA
jgi:hypothetical protein